MQIVQSVVGALGIWLIAAIADACRRTARRRRSRGRRGDLSPTGVDPGVCAERNILLDRRPRGTALVLQQQTFSPLEKGDSPLFSRKKGTVPFLGAVGTGLAILIRPTMLLFLPLGVAWLVGRTSVPGGGGLSVDDGARRCAVDDPESPRHTDAGSRSRQKAGVTFWTGNHPLARGDGDLSTNLDLKRAELAFRAAHPGLTPEQLEPLYYRDALAWIGAHPRDWLALEVRKAYYSVVPPDPPMRYTR